VIILKVDILNLVVQGCQSSLWCSGSSYSYSHPGLELVSYSYWILI